MGDVKLTKKAEKVLCTIYKKYLERIEQGETTRKAKDFNNFDILHKETFPEMQKDELQGCIKEICACFGIQRYVRSGIILNDAVLIFMEQRFPNGIKDVLERAALIKSAIPFL